MPNSASRLCCIVYVSLASTRYSRVQLAAFGVEFAGFNARLDVTGALFHMRGRFLQVLEGRCDVLEALMTRIRNDARHFAVRVLTRDRIDQRAFTEWSMGLMDLQALREDGEYLLSDLFRFSRMLEHLDEEDEPERQALQMVHSLPQLMDAYRIA